jgi:hypothetical protein
VTFGTKVSIKAKRKRTGYLHFRNRTIRLNEEELREFELKLREWNFMAVEKYKDNIGEN